MTILQQIALGLWGILPGNYSGITPVSENEYAIVNDKDKTDGFKLLTLDIDSVTGRITHASMREPAVMAQRRADKTGVYRDCEGVAYFPTANTVFVSGERDQRILEYSLDGMPTGRELQIPECMKIDKIVSNLGFEALNYNDVQGRFWTTTESTLPVDGEHASLKNKNVQNRLRFVAFDNNLQPVASYVYEMDAMTATGDSGNFILGVPSVLAMDDGRLLVEEREGYFPSNRLGSFVEVKIYEVNPAKSLQISFDTPMANVPESAFMTKKLIGTFTTRLTLLERSLSNYEGMCFGPRLADGRQTLLLIADSQDCMGNRFFRLKDNIKVIALDKDDL